LEIIIPADVLFNFGNKRTPAAVLFLGGSGKMSTNDASARERFTQVVLPHLDAAYNLARWTTKNEHDAEDVVQESCLRALRFIDSFRGNDSRAWVLSIVRNTCATWLGRNRTASAQPEELESASDDTNPEQIALRRVDIELLRKALEELPDEFREVIVLREIENLSYEEIAAVIGAPIGTVMSRLARGRRRLQERLIKTEAASR
jgi:RNA polymerase sigma-70 factor (ECF subfamily)